MFEDYEGVTFVKELQHEENRKERRIVGRVFETLLAVTGLGLMAIGFQRRNGDMWAIAVLTLMPSAVAWVDCIQNHDVYACYLVQIDLDIKSEVIARLTDKYDIEPYLPEYELQCSETLFVLTAWELQDKTGEAKEEKYVQRD